MGVYIKGMEMPQSCLECVFYRRTDPIYDYCCISYATPKEYVPNDCPLVPVPPHGRLIAADALMLKILDYTEEYSDVDEKGWHNLKWCAMKEAEMAINNAPTIIPADEGE